MLKLIWLGVAIIIYQNGIILYMLHKIGKMGKRYVTAEEERRGE